MPGSEYMLDTFKLWVKNHLLYIAGKFGEFGKLFMIRQTKTIQIINNLLADLLTKLSFTKYSKRVYSPNFLADKLFCYAV